MPTYPLAWPDGAWETSTTTGTGPYSLAGAVTGYQAAAAVGNGKSGAFRAEDVTGGGWENFIGTYTDAAHGGPSLSRDVILASSNSGAAVSWPAGTRQIFVTPSGAMVGAAVVNPVTSVTNADANLAYGTITLVKATAANHTVTLPAPALTAWNAPQFVEIKIDPASTKLVTLAPNATETIDGAGSRVMWAGESALLYTDGTNWFKRSGKSIPFVGKICASATTGAVVGDGTFHKVTTDHSLLDNSGGALSTLFVDTTNARVNVPRGGKWRVTARVRWNAVASACRVGGCAFPNGAATPYVALAEQGTPATTTYPFTAGSETVSLSAGDYLELFGFQTSGGALNWFGDGASDGSLLEAVEEPTW